MNMTILYANISPYGPNAEVKYEATKTDPEIAVIGVDFMTNSGLETNLGRNFTGFDIDNNNYCVVGSDLGKVYLKISIDKTISIRGARFKVIGIKEKGSTLVTNKI
jgi:putative ABC transport system permease protein